MEVDPLLCVEEVVMKILEGFGEEVPWENCGLYLSKDGGRYMIYLYCYIIVLLYFIILHFYSFSSFPKK